MPPPSPAAPTSQSNRAADSLNPETYRAVSRREMELWGTGLRDLPFRLGPCLPGAVSVITEIPCCVRRPADQPDTYLIDLM